MPAAENLQTNQGKSGPELFALYYHDVRSHLLEAAAAFDRFDKAGVTTEKEPRLLKLREIAAIVCDSKPERAKRFLEALSDE